MEVNTAMAELVAYALACDLSRVVEYTFFQTQASPVFWQIGVDVGHHGLGHSDSQPQLEVQKTVVFTMEQFAYLLGKLKGIPEIGSYAMGLFL